MKPVATVFGADCLLAIGTTFPTAIIVFMLNVVRSLPAISVITSIPIQKNPIKLSITKFFINTAIMDRKVQLITDKTYLYKYLVKLSELPEDIKSSLITKFPDAVEDSYFFITISIKH